MSKRDGNKTARKKIKCNVEKNSFLTPNTYSSCKYCKLGTYLLALTEN